MNATLDLPVAVERDVPIEPDSPAIGRPRSAAHDEHAPMAVETTVEHQPGWQVVNFREIWTYRELLYYLTWRDLKVRYKQTVLGAAWAVLQPLATMIAFSLFFGRLASVPTGGLPYPLFVFAGLLPWTFFANAVSSAGQSVVGSQNLVTKVYFPRLIIPVAATGAGLVDFVIACGMLLVLMLFYGVVPGVGVALVPVVAIGVGVAALGVGTLLAALTVAYRDFRYVVPFLVQLWMFATPSIYMQADSVLNGPWSLLLPLNPAYGLIANFRAAALGSPLDFYSLVVSSSVGVGLLVIGCLYFRRVERSFADII
jgi:lipopolysaccharide transport system permease protein